MRLVRLGKIIGYVEFVFIEKQFYRYIFNVSSQNSIINFMFFKTEIIPISVASLVVGGKNCQLVLSKPNFKSNFLRSNN